MESLLPGPILTKAGEATTIAALAASVDVIGLYFSAHWCPPCRNFTPKLSKFYEENAKKLKFELIFVSSDKEESSWKDYWSSMSFNAIPFSDRNLKNKLSGKYGVTGIPCLVLLDAKTGELIHKKGVEKVYSDPSGVEFPWKPKPFAEILGQSFEDHDGNTHSVDKLTDKHILIYFSASWCPPCQKFTPKLIEFYNQHHEAKNFEVIFVGSDRDDNSHKTYFKKMPWLGVPFADKSRTSNLGDYFEVEGIPHLVVLDKDRKLVTSDGVANVGGDAEAQHFPWRLQYVDELCSRTAMKLNDHAAVILLADVGGREGVLERFKVAAKEADEVNEAKAAEAGDRLMFMYSLDSKDNLVGRVRELFKADKDTVFIVSKLREGGFNKSDLTSDASVEDIRDLIAKASKSDLMLTSPRG